VRREVGFAGIELASFAGTDDLTGISDHSGLVKAQTKRVAHESAWHRVVAAHARVNIPKELAG
jgi:hypothetical protein